MNSLADIIAAMTPTADGWRATIPDAWLQGRTAYGGLSSALALHVAQRCAPDMPPLRSAQVAFVGPLAGDVTVAATLLRRGRNAAFVQADVTGDAGLGLRATFVFMRPIESRVDHRRGEAPCPPPPADAALLRGIPAIPFTQQFEMFDPPVEAGPAEWLRWIRLADRTGLDPTIELLAVADALPPAALKLLGGPAPVSSMTWLLNLLDPVPATTDGWWLLRARTDHAAAGNSSQAMTIWNAAGQTIAEHMQSVAIFG